MALPANRINLLPNPCMEATSGTVNIRTNLATNPNAASVTGYSAVAGTGGTAALTNQTSGGHTGTDFNRVTWSVATTAVSGGVLYGSTTGLTAGNTYAMAAWVRSNVAQKVYLGIDWNTNVGGYISSSAGVAVTLVANTWTRLTNVAAAPATATQGNLTVLATAGGLLWANGNTLDIDDLLFEWAPAVGTDFSGRTAAGGDFTYAWSGTTDASTSFQRAAGITGWTGTNATYSSSTAQFANHAKSGALISNGTTPATASTPTGTSGVAVSPSTSYALQGQIKAATAGRTVTAAITWYTAAGASISTSTGTGTLDVTTGFTVVSVVAVSPSNAAFASVAISVASPGNTETHWVDSCLLEKATTIGSYFDGDLPADGNYRYFWDGTANASTSEAEYRGVWVEQVIGSGCPKVQVTVSGMGLVAGNVQVTRTADNETWTVPGWYSRSVIDTDTDTDFAPPLGRTVTYTSYFNGVQINQMSLTVTSTTGWVQDPYDPTTAMPINTLMTDPTMLTLAHGALDSRTHVTNASKATVMGAKRQYSITGQRLPDGGIILILNAWQNSTSDAFKAMSTAPILLFRGLPSWGSLPGLAYMDGPVQEFAIDRYRKPGNNNALTQWTVTGDLIQPVSRQPLTGKVTNAQVQTNLTGVTNATIAARSGTKRNIDIKASPLSL